MAAYFACCRSLGSKSYYQYHQEENILLTTGILNTPTQSTPSSALEVKVCSALIGTALNCVARLSVSGKLQKAGIPETGFACYCTCRCNEPRDGKPAPCKAESLATERRNSLLKSRNAIVVRQHPDLGVVEVAAPSKSCVRWTLNHMTWALSERYRTNS